MAASLYHPRSGCGVGCAGGGDTKGGLAAQDTERAGRSGRRLLNETAVLAFALSAALPEELHASPELAYRLLRDSRAAGDGVPDEMVIGHTLGINASCGA
jgi:hypothetical protein